MRKLHTYLFLILFTYSFAQKSEVKLSTISFKVPSEAARGNKVIMSNDGISTYAWNRLKLDSAAYYYSYSFNLQNALFEFRECHKIDIYEGYETFFKPKFKQTKELKNYEISRFQNSTNEFMRGAFSHAIVEYDKGMRKLILFYVLDKTSLFLVSIKSKFNEESFLKAQNLLDTILTSAVYHEPLLEEIQPIVQKGELINRTEHKRIKLPFFVSNDFNNPVVQPKPDGGFVVAFAHAKGSEIFVFDKNFNQTNQIHHDKIIHDIAISEKGFFSLSSTDYNLLSYGIYPSLYLNKHNIQGEVELSQVVFKKNDVKLPGNMVFDYYSRDNVCLEIADTFGIIYMNAEKKWPDLQVLQSGAYKTFSLENGILKKGSEDLFHVTHCFSQVSTHDSKFAYLVSLGDNYPRGVCLSKVDIAIAQDSTDTTSFYNHLLYKISGTPGNNYVADTHLSEPLIYNNYLYIVIETEEGARTTLENNEYSTNRGHNDLFLIKCSLAGEELIVKQLTKTDKIEETNPKLVALGDELLLIYSEAIFDKQSGYYHFKDRYILLNERGGKQSILEEFNSYYQNETRPYYKMPDSPINRDGSNLVNLPDGNVLWVRLMKNSREIEVIKILKQE